MFHNINLMETFQLLIKAKKMICGYSDNDDGFYRNVPCIIFGDVTREIKYIDFPCFLGADGAVILKVINPNYDTKYLFYYLKCQSIPNTGYNRHYKFLKSLTFKELSLNEQKAEADILDSLNLLIDNEKAKINMMGELIKSRFNGRRCVA